MTTNDNNRRRRYEKPTVRIVELQHRTMLLQASATRETYGTAIEEEWE